MLILICSALLFAAGRIRVTAGGRTADGAVGFAGGILGGLAGLSGILPTLWRTLRGWARDDQRAVYQPYNLTILSCALVTMRFGGMLDRAFWILFAAVLPATMIGVRIGVTTCRHLADHSFRRVGLVVLLISGVALIATNL